MTENQGIYGGLSAREYRAREEAKSYKVVCPVCGAAPMYPCLSKNGNQKQNAHLPRMDAGRKVE